MSGDKWISTRCGDDKLSGDGGAEYPCVRRYRHRRLLTFLWLQGFKAKHESMVSESDAMMFVPHLQKMVLLDQWKDANRYLSGFLRRPTSVEAIALCHVFHAFDTLAKIVAGVKQVDLSKQQFHDHKRTIFHSLIRLRSIMLNAQQARASIDWERVKKKAAVVVDELVYATPELKDLIFMPRGPMKPHNVLPIAYGFRPRCLPKKQTRQPKSPAGVAKSYFKRWRRIPACSDPSQGTYHQRLTFIKAMDRMVDILDECLKAGKLEVHPLQTTETKAGNLVRTTQGGGYLLRDINSSLDDVSSSVNDLCVITNPQNKEAVKCRVLSTLAEIKCNVALLVAQTTASTLAGIEVPDSNKATDFAGASIFQAEFPEMPNSQVTEFAGA